MNREIRSKMLKTLAISDSKMLDISFVVSKLQSARKIILDGMDAAEIELGSFMSIEPVTKEDVDFCIHSLKVWKMNKGELSIELEGIKNKIMEQVKKAALVG